MSTIIPTQAGEVLFGESTADDTIKKWTDKDVETIIRCCWNAAREKELPKEINTFDKLVDYITPPWMMKGNEHYDKGDFKSHFKTCITLMEKYCWSYNWSDGFLKKLKKEKL